MLRNITLTLLLLAGLVCRTAGQSVLDPEFVDRIRQDTEAISDVESRIVGYEGHANTLEFIRAAVSGLPQERVRVWEHSFGQVVPYYEGGLMTVEQGQWRGRHTVYPLWPSHVRLNTTPEEGISGNLFYVGEGKVADIPGKALRGQIAAMEMSGGKRWTTLGDFGAAAVLLLGSPQENQIHAHSHILRYNVTLPRFYIPEGPLADAVRNGEIESVHLESKGEWIDATATNIYVLIRPREGAPPDNLMTLAVASDATSVVPGLTPGADAAIDLAFAVNIMRRMAVEPPERPVLITFIDASTFALKGMRQMLGALALTAEDREKEFKDIRSDFTEYRRVEEMAAQLEASGDLNTVLESLGDPKYKPIHTYLKDEANRQIVALDTLLSPLRLDLYDLQGAAAAETQRQVDELATRRRLILAAQRQLLTSDEIEEESRDQCIALWRRAREYIRAQFEENRALLDAEDRRDVIREEILGELNLPEHEQYPLGFILAVDISDSGVACGGHRYDCFHHFYENNNLQGFSSYLDARGEDLYQELWPGELRNAVNLGTLTGTMAFIESSKSHMLSEYANLSSPAIAYSSPGVMWTTTDSFRWRVDTGRDRADLLAWDRIGPQLEVTRRLLEHMTYTRDFAFPDEKPIFNWRSVHGIIVDQAPGEPLADLPMRGYITTLMSGRADAGEANLLINVGGAGGGAGNQPIMILQPTSGIRRTEYARTGADGQFHYEFFSKGFYEWRVARMFIQAYDFAPDGSVIRAIDQKKVSGQGVTLNVDLRSATITPLRGRVFTSEETSAYGFFDPRYLIYLPQATILDTRRASPPKRQNMSIDQGVVSLLLEPNIRWQIVSRFGVTRNRMALLNVLGPEMADGLSTREAMIGYTSSQRLPSISWHLGAHDFHRLNAMRLETYRKAGIRSQPVERLRERSEELLEAADTALEENRGEDLYRAAGGALANEVRAYQGVRDLANDVVRAAIFLLLMLVPFSYAFERLIFGVPGIYKQITLTGVVFFGMAIILWSFHPAFRISGQPMIILLAFGIILMSIVVMSMVYSKFEAELTEIRSGRAEASAAKTSRMGLLSTAIKLGIANMRKRKLRTLLTGMTIVLITFALLCFSSTTSYTGEKQVELDHPAEYTGVLLSQPGERPMVIPESLDYIETLIPEGAVLSPRYWLVEPAHGHWRVHVINPANGAKLSLVGGLGLTPNEAEVTAVEQVLPQWERFAEGDGIYLSVEGAAEIDAKPGDPLVLGGRVLTLIDVYEADRLTSKVKDLDGETIVPYDYSAMDTSTRDALTRAAFDIGAIAAAMEGGSGLDSMNLPSINANRIVVFPAHLAPAFRRFCDLRNVAIGTQTPAQAASLAREIASRVAYPVYEGTPDGVRVIATTPLLPRQPRSVVIPLLIAGLIIFNTMLSSIAERKSEIYIYTSLGLAPLHVGVLFLAEAVTYGLMGSIFGYIVGQGLATLLSNLGLLGNITLNYSGTQAVLVMFVVLIVVVLSSLVPAFLAGKLAAPSNEMSWKVPEPKDDVISDILPFTVTAQTAGGIMAYLKDYFEVHREGAIGTFTTDRLEIVPMQVPGLANAYALEGTVWLAPYDLGVRQDFRISLHETEDEDVFRLDIELIRGSGQTRSWWKLNGVFLSSLRKQLLGWRQLRPRRVMEYISSAERWRPAVAGG